MKQRWATEASSADEDLGDRKEPADLKSLAMEANSAEENLGDEYEPVEFMSLDARILQDVNRIWDEEASKLAVAEEATDQIVTEEDPTNLTHAEIEEILLNTKTATELYDAEVKLNFVKGILED